MILVQYGISQGSKPDFTFFTASSLLCRIRSWSATGQQAGRVARQAAEAVVAAACDDLPIFLLQAEKHGFDAPAVKLSNDDRGNGAVWSAGENLCPF